MLANPGRTAFRTECRDKAERRVPHTLDERGGSFRQSSSRNRGREGNRAPAVVKAQAVQPNVVSGVHARPDADCGADDERYGLGFGFSHGLGRRSIIATLMKELMGLCVSEHKHTWTKPLRGSR